MLARSNRLTTGRGFSAAIRRGRRVGRSTLVLHLSTEVEPSLGSGGVSDAGSPRVGLVVGRAVGDAVTRNQVKRRLRHVLRDRLETLPDGAVLVVRALPAAGAATSAGLARDVDAGLARLLGQGRA